MTISYALLETILASDEATEEHIALLLELSSAYGQAIESGSIQDVRPITTSRWWNELGLEGREDVIKSGHDEPDPDAFTLGVTSSYSCGDGAVAAFLERTFVESGELTVFFVVLIPDDSGELKIDYFHQSAEFNDLRSAEGLDVNDGYVMPVPWAEIQEHGPPELPAGATVQVNDGRCSSPTAVRSDAIHRSQRSWTISYVFLESIVASQLERFSASLDEMSRNFVGPGKLRIFFSFRTPDDLGEQTVINYFSQRSAEGPHVDRYGIVSVPWSAIREFGLPELPADTPEEAVFVTFACSSKGDDS